MPWSSLRGETRTCGDVAGEEDESVDDELFEGE